VDRTPSLPVRVQLVPLEGDRGLPLLLGGFKGAGYSEVATQLAWTWEKPVFPPCPCPGQPCTQQ
jgi:hypothetical protein